MLYFAACGDLTVPIDETLSTADLLILRLQGAAPAPQPASFVVSNARRTVGRLTHDDGFNTLYVELDFPAGSLEALDGSPLGPEDSLAVAVSPRGGEYGMTLSPAGLELGSGVSMSFFFGSYADPMTLGGSTSYASWAEFVKVLAVWEEVTPGLWRRVGGSGVTPADEATAPLSEAGTFVVAAPR